jgi:endoglucanase
MAAGLAALTAGVGSWRARADAQSWPHWEAYVDRFISQEGRVVSPTEHGRTTSEGQAYALFFALVNDDRPRFDALLRWTEAHLAHGDFRRHLPSWLWGHDSQKRWRVLDANSAADADLWLAYDLIEAGRLWREPAYTSLGRAVLARMRREETATLPGLGAMLLPAPRGFEVVKGKVWRLNPSYTPPQLLERLSSVDPAGPWHEILASSTRVLEEGSTHGLAADWVAYRAGRGIEIDPQKGAIGSYDAIRVYLWAGMMAPEDPLSVRWRRSTEGLQRAWRTTGVVPERVDVRTDVTSGRGPIGFVAALLPALHVSADPSESLLEHQLSTSLDGGLYGRPPAYYDQNLILFAHGFTERRFRFAADGSLAPRWGKP